MKKTAYQVLCAAISAEGGGGLCKMSGDTFVSCGCTLEHLGVCGAIEENCEPARRMDDQQPGSAVVLQPMHWAVKAAAQ